MKAMLTPALALVLAATAMPAAAQYDSDQPAAPQPAAQQPASKGKQATQQPSVQPSKKAGKAIVDLQTAVNNKDVANIPAKLAAAQALATTKEDRYLIGTLQLRAGLAANDPAAMSQAIDAIGASGYLDSAKTADLYLSLGGTMLEAKRYPQAVAAYQKALALNPQDGEAQRMLGFALFNAGQKTEALTALQRAIQSSVAAGRKPDENLYKMAVQVSYDSKSPAAVDLARQWVAAYPTESSWGNAIAIYRNLNLGDPEVTRDMLRLKQTMGILSGDEYLSLAGNAIEALTFDEAQAVVDAGIAARKIDPTSASAREVIGTLKAKGKPTPADLAAATKAAVNGKALMRIGDNYAALGDYAHAVEAYKLAMGKSDTDQAVAKLHIGMALARSGDKAGATAALNAVTGPRAGIAKYWLLYLAQKA